MRIVGGAWRGRRLVAPSGEATRPTADRVRQALFDRLMHAPWAGRAVVEGSSVLDGFAGTGALGLEALSRGAAFCSFIERDRAALGAMHANIAACRAEERCSVLVADVLRPPPGRCCGLVFLDPPYGQGLVTRALAALQGAGWIGPDTLVLAELGTGERLPEGPVVAEFAHGAARIAALRGAAAQ